MSAAVYDLTDASHRVAGGILAHRTAQRRPSNEDSRLTIYGCVDDVMLRKSVGASYNWSYADVAQPEEQRFRKPQVKGSSPFIGSTLFTQGPGDVANEG